MQLGFGPPGKTTLSVEALVLDTKSLISATWLYHSRIYGFTLARSCSARKRLYHR